MERQPSNLLRSLKRAWNERHPGSTADPTADGRPSALCAHELDLAVAVRARSVGLVLCLSPLPQRAVVAGSGPLPTDEAKQDLLAVRRLLRDLRARSGADNDQMLAYSPKVMKKAWVIETTDRPVEIGDVVRWAGWFGLYLAVVEEKAASEQRAAIRKRASHHADIFAARLDAELRRKQGDRAQRETVRSDNPV